MTLNGLPAWEANRKTAQFALGILFVIIIAASFTARTSRFAAPNSINTYDKKSLEPGRGVHVERMRSQDVVWELPAVEPLGVVLFAHGCHHSAGDLWPPSPSCPACLGLPEEMRLREAALRRRLVLIAISSLDRTGKRCWGELRKDGGANVAAILRDFVARERLQGLPLYTMGASSGGQMALTLPVHLDVAGVYSQVRGLEDLSIFRKARTGTYPPAAFVHMPRDTHNLAMIQRNMDALRAAKVPVLEVRILPRPVTAAFLSERSPLIDRAMGQRIVEALHESGVATPNGTLLEAPRPATPRWAPLVQPIVGDLSLALDESHVGELVNLAWAKHELVSDEAEAVLAWLQGGGAGGLSEARRRAEAQRRAFEAEVGGPRWLGRRRRRR